MRMEIDEVEEMRSGVILNGENVAGKCLRGMMESIDQVVKRPRPKVTERLRIVAKLVRDKSPWWPSKRPRLQVAKSVMS